MGGLIGACPLPGGEIVGTLLESGRGWGVLNNLGFGIEDPRC